MTYFTKGVLALLSLQIRVAMECGWTLLVYSILSVSTIALASESRVDQKSNVGGASASNAITMPSQTGETVTLIACSYFSTVSITGVSSSGGSHFTQIGSSCTNATGNEALALFYYYSPAGSSVTVSFSGTAYSVCSAVSYGGTITTGTPIENYTCNSSSSSSMSLASLNATNGGEYWIGGFSWGGSATATVPSGFSTIENQAYSGGTNFGALLADQLLPSSGSTGSASATLSASQPWATFDGLLLPAGTPAVTDQGYQTTGTITCPNTASLCNIDLAGTGVIVDAAAPSGSVTQLLGITLHQVGNVDCTANTTPWPCCTGSGAGTCNATNAGWWNTSNGNGWSSAFSFIAASTGGALGSTPPIPVLASGGTEEFIFQYSPILGKYVFLSRTFNQAASSQLSTQGGSEGIGNDPGNGGVTQAFNIPVGCSGLVGDNGGFFVPQYGGVNVFHSFEDTSYTVYNNYSTPGFVSFVCTGGINQNQDNALSNPILLQPGESTTWSSHQAPQVGQANINFGSNVCGACVSVPMQNTYHSSFIMQLPAS